MRAWVTKEGYEALAEIKDEGWSAAYLERPGLDKVRDLVEAGGVSAVAALFTRVPEAASTKFVSVVSGSSRK